MVRVIVLGTLGDLVKKICELELLEREPSRDTTVQMAAYYGILEQWPTEDKDKVNSLLQSFRLQCAKHIAIEQSMTELSMKVKGKIGSSDWIMTSSSFSGAADRYLVSKNLLRTMLSQLNSLGQHVGLPPITMELENGEESSLESDSRNEQLNDVASNEQITQH